MKKEDLIGKSLFELYPREVAQAYLDDDLEVISSGKPKLNYEEPWETADGLRWALTSKIPLIDVNGEVTGLIGTSIDITERKNAEEKLKRTLETTKKILDSLPIGIILVGYDKKIESVNKVALKLLEMDDEFEILGKICHHNICVAEIGSCPIIDLGQKIDQSEKCLINRFGKEVPILKSVIPITLGDNNYLLEAFVDISSLKETEEKLKESHEKYRDLLDTSSMGVLDVNLVNREIEYFNPKLLELLGYSKEELHDSNLFYKIVHPEDIQKLFKSRDDGNIEFRIDTKDGKRKWIACNRLFQYNKKGELIKLRLWMQDISERKKGESLKRLFTEKLEKEVQSRTKDLMELLEKQRLYLAQIEKSSRFKTEFMATMSHELRTPLNAIIGFTDLLLESVFGELNEEQLEFVKDIEESSKHLLEMITQILNISKIEAGQDTLTVEEIHLNDLVNYVISTLTPLYNKKELIIDLKGLKKEQLIFADRIKFKQIVYNLLSNAIKFTEKGKVTFEFRDNKDTWDFNVKDTGIGIAEKDFNIIFKDFKRVKSTYVDSIAGSGLGLALTKRVVNLHGGDILFTSKLGKGTTFTFTIPKNLRKKVNSEIKVEAFLSKL
jgi:PAS domain S-box-containing protein